MYIEKIKNKGQAQLFQTQMMENLTKTHPLVIYSIYIPVVLLALYYGASYKGISKEKEAILFISGVFFWTLFEYMMHRFLFHMKVIRNGAQKIIYTMHGVHHEFPRDRERLFMPPVPSIVVSSLIFLLFYGLMGWMALAFFSGFLIGYLLYGSMHFAIHAFAPPKFLKALWRNHHLHHYQTDDKGFGVSSILWDIIFRTMPQKRK